MIKTTKEFFEIYPDFIDVMKEGKKCKFWNNTKTYIGYSIGFQVNKFDKYYFKADDGHYYPNYQVIKSVPYVKSKIECMKWIEENNGEYCDNGKFYIPGTYLLLKYNGSFVKNEKYPYFNAWNLCDKKFDKKDVYIPNGLIEWREI